MKSKICKQIIKLLFLLIPIISASSLASCSFFITNTQWSKRTNSNIGSNNNNQVINYASTKVLKQQYENALINIQNNWINNFQTNIPKWNNFNPDLKLQLQYELEQWNNINQSNDAKYLATLYPLLWSLNNALITLDWYFINYLIVEFIASLKPNQFSFLPILSTSTSYISLLSKLNWTEILLNPKWLIFKHDFKEFLQNQNISITLWNDNLKSYCGSWIYKPNQEWILNQTYCNIQVVNLGFISFNWLMMNEEVPTCFSEDNKTNLQVNNWNYFNDQSTSKNDLQKIINNYESEQNLYYSTIKYLVFKININ